MYLADAARLLDITAAAVRKRVAMQQPTIRGLAPNSALNPTGKWMVSTADVEAEARRRGRFLPGVSPAAGAAPPLTAGAGLSTDEVRVQLLQGDYVDALRAQLAEKDARIELLERLVAEKDTRLAERDEQITRQRRQLRAIVDVD
jgi:hypothetical protein